MVVHRLAAWLRGPPAEVAGMEAGSLFPVVSRALLGPDRTWHR